MEHTVTRHRTVYMLPVDREGGSSILEDFYDEIEIRAVHGHPSVLRSQYNNNIAGSKEREVIETDILCASISELHTTLWRMISDTSPDAKYKKGSRYWIGGREYGNLGLNCHDFAEDFITATRLRFPFKGTNPTTGKCR